VKQHLNTLFITTEGAYLARSGESLIVRVENETKLRVPIHTLGGIVCFGRVRLSPSLMGLCGERDVCISLLSSHGKFLAQISGFVSGNVLLRREQYRRSDMDSESSKIARAMIAAKVANSRSVLLRHLRDNPETAGEPEIEKAATYLAGSIEQLRNAAIALDAARGIEGDSASCYFGVFNHLVVAQKEDFVFRSRNRRPPLDAINALLSFLYAMLGHDLRSACQTVGLDPQVGFLHRDRPGRAGLALDLMEEFRPFLADRLALSLINRRQVSASGFQTAENGAVMMNDATRKAVLVAYQKRKQEELVHPFLGEKVTVGLLPHLQARLLARYLRNDLDAYPPFIWK
jgi:CRISPR-associated protein Cas1